MIILVTGVPGSGKTLYTISKLLQEDFKDRTAYVNNIKNLLLPHEVLSDDNDPPAPESDVLNWYDGRLPAGAVIVIDEAQRVFRPRSATSAVPPHVAKLEIHRHMGLDFVLITQHPQLIDANVRRLVGRHLDVRRAFGTKSAIVYEWDHCHMDTKSVRQASKSIFRYKQKDFALYKSAELHTKPTNRMPFIVKAFVAVLFALPFIGYFAYNSLTFARIKDDQAVAADAEKSSSALVAASSALPSDLVPIDLSAFEKNTGRTDDKPLSPAEYRLLREPRVDGLLHTAPVYDGLTVPSRVPLPVSCMSKKDDCKCFTQNGTPYKTTIEICREITDNGIFLDFHAEVVQSEQESQMASVK